jgi:mRNA interferase MazF
MKRADVWWVEFYSAIGGEVRKTRPAVMVSNDSANRHLERVVVVPITSNVARVYPGETIVKPLTNIGRAFAGSITISTAFYRITEGFVCMPRATMVDEIY